MRRVSKEKEIEALLSGENDSCSCFIEVQAGAGGTESMDWASMVMQMYKMWAQRRGYAVTIVEEMPGELAGIKVFLLAISSVLPFLLLLVVFLSLFLHPFFLFFFVFIQTTDFQIVQLLDC